MIYRVVITKAGQAIFSHDILMQVGFSFSDQFQSAMETFRKNYPDVSLMDDDVELKMGKAQ